jgi:2-octaprenyl-6-methoxyphenol hydroxylase
MSRSSAAASPILADAVVVGGGLVGSALACALDAAGLAVAVVERGDPEAALGDAFDGRASAIALASQRVLAGLDLWPDMADEASPIEDIRVSEGASPLFLHYGADDGEARPFGYMLENRHIRRALWRGVGRRPGVRVVAPARITALDRDGALAEARLADGRRLRAPLFVGADGRGSWVRRQAAIRVTGWSYGQTAIVCTVAHELPHGATAHERFLAAGPFAILPLKGNRSSIVWTERAAVAPALMALGEADFEAELGLRFGDFLGDLSLVGPRWSHPLSLQFAETALARRLALVGDAAHAMHPIAGQGLNMGLRDVAALAEVMVDARRLGLDLGGADVLGRFERWRRFDNTLMLAMTDALNRLFSNQVRPLRLARDLGLAAVDRVGPLKRLFVRHAMGLAGDLPRLVRGEAL